MKKFKIGQSRKGGKRTVSEKRQGRVVCVLTSIWLKLIGLNHGFEFEILKIGVPRTTGH